MKGLERNVAERKIPIFVNADVKDIHTDNGVVDGVKVQIQGEKAKPRRFRVNKPVLDLAYELTEEQK